MTDVLDKIDASLEEVEEQLLAEFRRVRQADDGAAVAELDAGVRNALIEVVDLLHDELENSSGTSLQLVTDRHEILFARVAVLSQLLRARVPTSLLLKAHDGVKERRARLESRVLARREQDNEPDAGSEPRRGGMMNALRGMFDHRPSEQQIARNKILVTRTEEEKLDQNTVYLDNGIYSASRELAMLVSLLRGGTLDRPPESQTTKGRATFEARELSTSAPVAPARAEAPAPKPKPAALEDREIAQTPEDIRRKLEARRDSAAAGKASFAARDIEPVAPQEFRSRRERTRPQEPTAPATGKAMFVSKDIEPAAPQEFKKPREPRKAPEVPREPPRTGKATFAAKDIEPTYPQEPPRPRARKDPEPVDLDPVRPGGKAIFEARELSTTPRSKKD